MSEDGTTFGSIKIYEILRNRVEHEDKSINARLTWFLLIQAALYALFFNVLSGEVDIKLMVLRLSLELALPVAGIWSCVLLNRSLTAAYDEINTCETDYSEYVETAPPPPGVPRTLLGRNKTHASGHMFARTLPWFCFVTWLAILGLIFARSVNLFSQPI